MRSRWGDHVVAITEASSHFSTISLDRRFLSSHAINCRLLIKALMPLTASSDANMGKNVHLSHRPLQELRVTRSHRHTLSPHAPESSFLLVFFLWKSVPHMPNSKRRDFSFRVGAFFPCHPLPSEGPALALNRIRLLPPKFPSTWSLSVAC